MNIVLDTNCLLMSLDCAFKANARYIVTQDHHYDVLKQTPFPFIDVVGIDEFIKVLRG